MVEKAIQNPTIGIKLMVEFLNIKKYEDIDGKCLVEIRSNGHQTVIPPSIHPSGETLEWLSYGTPKIVTAEELERAVSELAAAVMLAQALAE